MTITVEELRRKYPNPVSFAKERVPLDAYCVGKALCLEIGMSMAVWDIQHALHYANPNLTPGDLDYFYVHITAENDAENFDVAWAWLDKALSA